jgi:E3 ubiquitin-protein ligase HUWE1
VNESNKAEYVRLVCEYKMIGQIKSQTAAFKQGFFEIFPRKHIHLLNWRELGMKLSGTPTIDSLEIFQ